MRKLEQTLDTIFSIFIRRRRADFSGYVRCYTCPAVLPWQEMDAGHWQRRGNHATRWEPDNAAAQCQDCNRYFRGKEDVFEENLRDDLGDERVDELKKLARDTVQFTENELKAKIAYFKDLVSTMERMI